MTMIDCYGHDATSERFQKREYRKHPYLIDSAEGTTYVCFSKSAKRPIHRIVENGGNTEILWAFGSWDERASLNYTSTLNDPIMISEEDAVEG